ncbi:hypothetical protein PIB30_064289 [Stylosanthes scabra]|uniref:Uncharacterized protein n=1 Tax=Stylosanthes scabra TaxID=79078 RepID=A0ABU6WLL3_9FABA|nr:hypothetical protein [Stylosanthes scabra]
MLRQIIYIHRIGGGGKELNLTIEIFFNRIVVQASNILAPRGLSLVGTHIAAKVATKTR